MRILLLTQDFPPQPGGISIFLHNICLQLHRLGHQVDVLTVIGIASDETRAEQFYHIHRYKPSSRLSSIVPIISTLVLHSEYHYDVIFIGHMMTTHALGVLVLHTLRHFPYIILSHGNDLTYSLSTKVDAIIARSLLTNANLILGNSYFTAERVRDTGRKGPVEVLSPGVDLARFHPGVDTSAVRQRYGLSGRRVLLTTARLVAKKNVDTVLRVLPRVIDQVADVLFLIAGDGEERVRLEEICDDLRLRPYVRFLGYVENSQLPAIYCASHLFVMPTRGIESFGIAFIEAGACGLPVIGSQCGGTEDAVVDGETGLLVNSDDTDELAGAIVRLLTDEGLAKRLGKNGRLRAERELSWEKRGEQLEKILLQVLDK